MKKFINKLESKVGVDIDGDGLIGGKHPGGAPVYHSSSSPSQNYPPPQQNFYSPQQSGYSGQQNYPPQQQQYYPPQQQQQYYPPQQQQQHYPPQQQQYAPQGNVMNFHPGNGQRKALLIGINYIGQKGQLRGCVNDVNTMRNFIQAHGYSAQGMRILVDDPSWQTPSPTRQNMIQAFQWLVQGARPGDNLFFHYSGHGGRVRDTNGDEADGYDETILPVDFAKAGQITDDDLFAMLVQPLAAGVRLTAVMDCCHSGTVLDLPYVFKANRSTMSAIFPNGVFNPAALPPMITNGKFNKKGFLKLGLGLAGQFLGGGHHSSGGGKPGFQSDSNKQVAGDVIMFSGCADNQTSADVANAGAGGAGGACTNALVTAFNARPNLTFIQLLEDMRIDLERKRYSQVPQLSSSRPLDLMQPFSV